MASNELTPRPNPQPDEGAGAIALRRANALQTEVLAARAGAQEQDDDAIDLRVIWRALLKHKLMIGSITLVSVLAAGIYTLRATPLYESTVMLQIDRAAQKVVSFNSEVEVDQGAGSDQLQLRTQIELLKSRSLAERVIDELNLHRPRTGNELPGGAAPGGEQGADGTAEGDGNAQDLSLVERMARNFRQLFTPATSDELAIGREATIQQFAGSLAVEPIRNSRLVEVKVLNSDPELAARIANQLAKAAIAVNLERKTESSVYARQYLEDQIKQTKAKLEESERQINDYAKKNEILNLGEKGSATTQTFVDFSEALSKAEQERIRAEAQYNQIRQNPESAPQVFANVAIQTYKEQKAKLEAEYAKNLAVFKPEFPAMVQAKAQIEQLDARIKDEVDTVLRSIRGQYDAARQQEASLRAKVASSKAEVQTVQDRSVDLNLLKRELDTNRQVYDSLLQRLKEVSVTANLTTNNLSVADEAKVPLFPAKPKPLINLALGSVLGLFLGMLAALLREQMDDTIKHADEVEALFGLPLLGWIPMTRNPKGNHKAIALQVQTAPRGAFAEAYRSMRTALQFATPEGAPRRLLVTSCSKSEGKSTTAIALAITFAQLGQRVLLIDADMRKASVHKALRLPNERGLSNLLSGDVSLEGLIHRTPVKGLRVMTAGPTPPDPVELLMGPKLTMFLDKAHAMGFAHVIVDGPPLLGLADAIVLGNQVQHIIFALKSGDTKRSVVKDSLRRLRTAGLAPMGVVLTHARDEHAPGYGYGYQSYYGYGEDQQPKAAPAAARSGATGTASAPAAGDWADGDTVPGERDWGHSDRPDDGLDSALGGAPSRPFVDRPAARRPRVGGRTAWTAGVAVVGLSLIVALVWTLLPGPTQESVAAPAVTEAPKADAPPAVAAAPATPAPTAAPPATAAPVAVPVVATAPETRPAALDEGVQDKAPPLASLKDSPAETWAQLSGLWKAGRIENCDDMLPAGLQCVRFPVATMSDLRLLDRPGLVQLRDGDVQRWVVLGALDDQRVVLRSGTQAWRLPLAEFEKQWTGAYSSIWRLPPGHKSRVFVAKLDDTAGRWLDEQLRKIPEAQGATYDERVSSFQKVHRLPGEGRAMPSTFLLVNRIVGRDEPRLR